MSEATTEIAGNAEGDTDVHQPGSGDHHRPAPDHLHPLTHIEVEVIASAVVQAVRETLKLCGNTYEDAAQAAAQAVRDSLRVLRD